MIIPGQVSIDTSYYAVKLTSIESGFTLSSFSVGDILTGGTSGVTAEVVNTVATDGTDPDTIYVKYNKTGTDNTDLVFADGETLTSNADTPVTCSCRYNSNWFSGWCSIRYILHQWFLCTS